jgi:hypothetical protein
LIDTEPVDIENLGVVTETHVNYKGDIHQIEKPSESSYQYTSNSTNPISSLANKTHRTESHLTPYRDRPPVVTGAYVTHYSPAGYKHEVHKEKEISESLKFKPLEVPQEPSRHSSREASLDSEYLQTGENRSKPRGSRSKRNRRRNGSKSKDPIFKTFSPSKRVLSDNQFITHHIDNVHTKPPRKHVFPAT